MTLDRQVDYWLQRVAPRGYGAPRAEVTAVIDETHDVRTFVLAPMGPWPGHRAGQFVTVEVEVDGVRLQRCYSLASAPGDRELSITVKRVPGGRVSSWMHDRVGKGSVLGLGLPRGELTLGGARTKALLVSGGSGITPVMANLRDLAQRGALHDVVFLHAARSPRDLVFRDELRNRAARHPGLRLLFVTGERLDRAALARLVPDLAEREALLCGPPEMMEALAPAWTEHGLAGQLKLERFTPLTRLGAVPSGAPSRVSLTLLDSGRTVEGVAGATVLEQLEHGGERPPYGCRMGICNTCTCRKRSGTVENVVTGAISSDPDEDIRPCISRALTDVDLAFRSPDPTPEEERA